MDRRSKAIVINFITSYPLYILSLKVSR